MFDYKRPCNNCPFRKNMGPLYQLKKDRLKEIFAATAFECHKTTGIAGEKREPQQCAGLIALLHKENMENQITQVARRLIGFDPSVISGINVYDSFRECFEGHGHKDTSL